MIDRTAIAAMIPHDGAMCLLHAVTQWGPTHIRARAHSHRDADHPMAKDGRLHVLCGVEYAAQAMAVHGALTAGNAAAPKSGYLASLRDVRCHVAWLDALDGDLDIQAEQLFAENGRVIYGFELSCNAAPVLTGRAALVLDAA